MSSKTEKYNQILESAARLFASLGYRKTSVDDIVREARVSKGLYYHYFSDKKQLYLQLYEQLSNDMVCKINERIDCEETDFLQRVRQIAHLKMELVQEKPYLFDFMNTAYFETDIDVAPYITERNHAFIAESHNFSLRKVDLSRFTSADCVEKAIELVIWASEGFMKKLTADGNIPTTEQVCMFDDYLLLLEHGIYQGGKHKKRNG